MSDPYRKVKAGRLTFKGGDLATIKSIDKKKKKKKHHKKNNSEDVDVPSNSGSDLELEGGEVQETSTAGEGGENVYTIDAAKKMKYEELFPVEARKFGYDPNNKTRAANKSVEDALDDRVKKKADRYCK